jgi:plastocyanin
MQPYLRFARLRQPRCRELAFLLCIAGLASAPAARAGSANGTYAAGTFINSAYPDNNNGGVAAIDIGNDFSDGSMRGLVRFNLPAALNERASITGATLTMTVTSVPPDGSAAAATVAVERLTENWGQGNGAGAQAFGSYTAGSACTGSGATWNKPLCSGAAWATAGGSVAGVVSASAFVSATPGTTVQWNAAGMASDVQAWADDATSNHGWRLRSSTEASFDLMQAFSKAPQLVVTYSCKSGFLETASGCTTCTTSAKAACVISQAGNACLDSGPPSTTYSCSCNNAAYATGPGGTSCVDKNECAVNHCTDFGDAAAACSDHVAPATGYSCLCSDGFVASGGTCVDYIFVDGFDAIVP